VEALPSIAISLVGGHIADKFNKKITIYICVGSLLFCSTSLFGIAYFLNTPNYMLLIYSIIFLSGLARGVLGPTLFSFWPTLLESKDDIPQATIWNSIVWQFAITAGPILGGLLITTIGLAYSYAIDAFLIICSLSLFYSIRYQFIQPTNNENESLFNTIKSGLSFVFGNQIILSAISLDLFAVLFGGATAMLPAFVSDVLLIDSSALGLLKSAIGIGSILIIILFTFRPIKKNAGKYMIMSVVGFGMSIIGFGLSTTFWMAFLMLFLSGIFDGVSVIIRSTLIQLYTPSNMKGRVSAVNNIFIGSSNEIGAFESGLTAKLFGLVPSIIIGGVMSILVALIIGLKAKKLIKLDF
jgi:MFS family permease